MLAINYQPCDCLDLLFNQLSFFHDDCSLVLPLFTFVRRASLLYEALFMAYTMVRLSPNPYNLENTV